MSIKSLRIGPAAAVLLLNLLPVAPPANAQTDGTSIINPTDPARFGLAMGNPPLRDTIVDWLNKAQVAMKSQNYRLALADVSKASRATWYDYEKLAVDHFAVYLDLQLGLKTDALKAAQEAADLATIDNSKRQELYTDVVVLALNAKNYERAIDYAKRMELHNFDDPTFQQAMGQAFYYGGDNRKAQAVLQNQIDSATAKGQTPNRYLLQMMLSAQAQAHDEIGTKKTLEMLAAYYNDPDAWRNAADLAFFESGLRDIDSVNLGRLLLATGAQLSQQNIDRLGQAAARLGFLGDTANAARLGATGFSFDAAKADAERQSIPTQLADGISQDGQYNVKLAESLLGYGMYADAEKTALEAQSKGGIADPTEPAMAVGIALMGQGHYAQAVTAFGQVQGGSVATQRVATLWQLFAKAKADPPPATTAAK